MPSLEVNKLQSVSAPKALGGSDRAQLESRPRDVATPAPQSGDKPGVSVEVSQTAAATEPPVNNERVEQIRDALRNGRYPLVPAEIADAMIAARLSPTIAQESGT